MLVFFPTLANKPKARKNISPDRRPTNEDFIDQQPSGLNLEQVECPEDEEFDQNNQVSDVLDGLNWYAKFQISIMSKRKNKDGIDKVFIQKLKKEMKESQVVVYRQFQKNQDSGEDFGVEQFGDMDIASLSQILGTFMPIVKL